MRRRRYFVFDKKLRVCEVLTRQNQSVRYAFYYVYVCPTSALRGFRYGYRRYKGNIFISYSFFFYRQNLFLWSDLTLLNTNISKKSSFPWFFLLKSLCNQRLFRIFATREPAKPLNDAQMCGSFLFYNLSMSKYMALMC